MNKKKWNLVWTYDISMWSQVEISLNHEEISLLKYQIFQEICISISDKSIKLDEDRFFLLVDVITQS